MDPTQVPSAQSSGVSATTTALNNSQSLSQAKPYCPRCGRNDCVNTYTAVESSYYHYPPDCRRYTYPHLDPHSPDYYVEADFNNYAYSFGADMDDFDFVGPRTRFCCFRPKKNSIVYVCYYKH